MATKQQRWTANYNKKYPHKNRWYKLRYRAQKRGIVFTITYEYFRDFCMEHEVEGKTGRTAECLSFDRKKNHLGYIEGNIQILTVSQNSMKGTIPEEELPDWYNNRPNDTCPF